MESATPMVLFLLFLFGGLWLILMLNYQSAEARRRELAEDGTPTPEATVPGFFAALSESDLRTPAEVSEQLVREVEAFLTTERRQARRFVRAPSLEGLFDDPVRARSNGDADLVSRFVSRERSLAQEFVATPTVEGLHRRGPRPVWHN